jgi:hypothetical protein
MVARRQKVIPGHWCAWGVTVEHSKIIIEWIDFVFGGFLCIYLLLAKRIAAFGALVLYLLHCQKPVW